MTSTGAGRGAMKLAQRKAQHVPLSPRPAGSLPDAAPAASHGIARSAAIRRFRIVGFDGRDPAGAEAESR